MTVKNNAAISRVINQGGFGCIFYPSLPCKKETKRNSNTSSSSSEYVSKLVKKNFSSKNEIRIGKIIQGIPFYSLYYVPVIQSCTASLAKVSEREIKKCSIISGKSSSTETAATTTATNANIESKDNSNKFILLKMKYVENVKFTKYLLSSTNKKHILNTLFDTYSYFLFSLEQLMKNGIVHYDFKWDNAVIDLKTGLPVILDFGISIPINLLLDQEQKQKQNQQKDDADAASVVYDMYRDYFYVYFPEYSLWSIEIHLVNYVLNKHSRITPESLKQTIETYVDSNGAFTILSPEFIERYKKLCYSTLERFIDQSRKYVISECLKYWNTWDNYALSISYLQIIKFISTSGFTSNQFLISFSEILMDNIHPDPARRSDYATTRYKYKSIFYQDVNIESYELLIDNFDFDDFRSNSVKESKRNEDMFSQMSQQGGHTSPL
jgi:serine/threonine protein kinase